MIRLLKKILFLFDPETAHNLVKELSKTIPVSAIKRWTHVADACLIAKMGSLQMSNPIGLAAGFDKNAEMLDLIHALDFGHAEIGSVTAIPSPGNPKPRIFRLLKDESLINWMGLPNEGASKILERLKKNPPPLPIGINIAKTPGHTDAAVADYVTTYTTLATHGDYVVFNLSCPNTEDGKTFEDPVFFAELAGEIKRARQKLGQQKPHLIKISPDLNESGTENLVTLALKNGMDGFVVSNTTKKRTGLVSNLTSDLKSRGGLSGRGLKNLADKQLAVVRQMAGPKAHLIGVGGILEFDDLVKKLHLGANLVQIYTGFIYRGPFFVRDLNLELLRLCQKLALKHYSELSKLSMREIKSAVDAP